MLTVKYHLETEEAKKPTRADNLSSGHDLYAAEEVLLMPNQSKLISTGVRIQMLSSGDKLYEAQVRPRSGLALKHGITVLNTPGTIDQGYTGPVGVILYNTSLQPYTVNVGDRIAQLVYVKVEVPTWLEVDYQEFSATERGGGGFGSSGK